MIVATIISLSFVKTFLRNKKAVFDFYLFVYEKMSNIDVIYARRTKDVSAILISKSDILDLWLCPYVGLYQTDLVCLRLSQETKS